MLKLKNRRRVIEALRQDRPGIWSYRSCLGDWVSDDRQEICLRVHTGGWNESGEPLPGSSYYVYRIGTMKHLEVLYP